MRFKLLLIALIAVVIAATCAGWKWEGHGVKGAAPAKSGSTSGVAY